MRFLDREDAGRQLAERLASYRDERPIVLALPRGGVEVGYEVARELNAPLDVIVARKLGAPDQPELGIGAVAPGGVILVDDYAVRMLRISQEEIERVAAAETEEMERRLRRFRGDRPMPDLTDRTVLLVDDGLATGVTARAAIRAIRQWNARRIVLAVPVCAPETARALTSEVDEIVCLFAPSDFRAVGLWYEQFDQTSDDEVVDLLERARREWTPPAAGFAEPAEGSARPGRDGGRREGRGADLATVRGAGRRARADEEREVRIAAGSATLAGNLGLHSDAIGVVLFAHGSGSGRHSPRNRYVARALRDAELGTLLIDLLTTDEEAVDLRTREHRFDIGLLARRLVDAIDWLGRSDETRDLPIGLFGASTGAAAALAAAAQRPEAVRAVVSRGGRPDLAGDDLPRVQAPTLLIVGGNDPEVLDLNRAAMARLRAEIELKIVPRATHLFEEPGALEEVARLAAGWFANRLGRGAPQRAAEPATA